MMRRFPLPPRKQEAISGTHEISTVIIEGPLRMREALAKSKNLVSIRILQAIGVQYAQDYVARFGFDPKQHPALSADGIGRRFGYTDTDGGGLCRVRQWRLSRNHPISSSA